jgi:serine/threonine protein kinase
MPVQHDRNTHLGAGAMGEVYRARDTRLGREVAIKILPPVFLGDRERLARFEREARVLASLNHPHIGAIYDVEEVDGILALVLEIVDGTLLAGRIARGPIPVDEARAIACQVADAMEAAHERGIVHRDLKPANIKITSDGNVKVLDFGLAKAFVQASDETDRSGVTADGTQGVVVLGTPVYMSPEQARGRPADARADICAFGRVLYEMLTGCTAFTGDNVSDTIAKILEREPDWRALPEGTPSGVRHLLQWCLEKDPRRRLRDIGDARAVLTRDRDIDAVTKRGVLAPLRIGKTMTALGVLSIAAVVAVFVAIRLWLPRQPSSDLRPTPVRFSIPPPQGGAFEGDVERTYLAFSPDGSQLAFIAAEPAGARRIWLRPVSAIESRPLSGTEGAGSLF